MATVTAPTGSVEAGVLRIELPGTPLESRLAAALFDLVPSPDDLDAPAVLLLTGPRAGDFAGLGAVPDQNLRHGPPASESMETRGSPPHPVLPLGLRDGFPGGQVARCISALAGFSGISVAALTGDAMGCGAELALACDLRVAWNGARLRFPHVAHGRVPACGATQRLPRLVGPGAAFRMLLLGEEIRGEDMVVLGLAAATEPTADAAGATATELAARLARQSAPALRACKEAVLGGGDLTLRGGLRLEADLAILLHTSQDRAEGIRAFLEKRPPRFVET